mmetsp:Transcript_42769/g.68654  ORF Transcript_42769/g.68654 Transcript_42769/m.68654 type:complete len:200 (+) Transcript_42769:3-602(+)
MFPVLHSAVQLVLFVYPSNDAFFHATQILSDGFWILQYGCMLSFVCGFLYKLIRSFRSDIYDGKLLSVIKKTSILSVAPLALSLISGISVFLHGFDIISMFLITFAVCSNFLCVVFSFQWFHLWYVLVCGCADKKCDQCWSSRTNINRANNTHSSIVYLHRNPLTVTSSTALSAASNVKMSQRNMTSSVSTVQTIHASI